MPKQVSLQHEIFPTFIISVLLTPVQITKVKKKKKNLLIYFFFNSLFTADSLLAVLVDREPDMVLCLCNEPRSQMSARKSVWRVFFLSLGWQRSLWICQMNRLRLVTLKTGSLISLDTRSVQGERKGLWGDIKRAFSRWR